ncbi:type II toxin-antitoxin system RelE/ParE family toxin [Massilia cavernae]|uniref:Type II toxin-antitoxin system RelE/ParE family toxin n=1 Tax=Massilia cavernae TaxID=2320864 RepID=A0A418XW20_9BURK|nr:type II toxin-antitoxin system RelE/ParE family toxin [Massilia cavernae]RJG16973.1 type II toxin-antitoxin system RelE/ParE family toxin [Massilia cavernae]
MKLIWSRRADCDRDTIIARVAHDSPAAAWALNKIIKQKTSALLAHPLLYRRGQLPDTREMVIHPHYVVIYRVTSSAVEILRIKHTAQS